MLLEKKTAIILFVFLIFLSFTFPVLSIFLMILYVSVLNSKIEKLFLSLVLILFALVNSSKVFENDIVWYYDHYLWINQYGFDNYYGNTISGVVAKITEPVTYTIFYIIGKIIGDNKVAFITFFSLFIYSIIIFAILNLFKYFNLNRKYLAIGTFFVLNLGFTFTLSVHLLRQFLAQAIILLAFSLFLRNKKLIPLFLILIALLTHNSSFLIVFLIFLVLFINKFRTIISSFMFAVSCFLTFLFSSFLIGTQALSRDGYVNKDDGSIAISVYIMDLILFFSSLLFFYFLKNKTENIVFFRNFIFQLTILYSIVLIVFFEISLIFLRFSFYFEVIRVFILCFIVKMISEKFKYNFFLVTVMFFVSLFYLYLRMESSDFEYLIQFKDILMLNLFGMEF